VTLRAILISLVVAALLALPAAALAATPTDDLYANADSRESTTPSATTTDPGKSGLAFTGLDVGLVALAGATILGTGLAIRRATRPD
jgi:hypothetical protein